MTNESVLGRLGTILNRLTELAGKKETTSIVPNLEVIDNNPTNLTGYVIVQDNRDGDYIPALKVPGVLYAIGDLVNVLFIAGTEPIAYQQASGSSGDAISTYKLVSPDEITDPVLSADNNGDITLAAGGDLYVPDDIIHTGDIDTFISLETDQVVVQAGGSTLTLDNAANLTAQGIVISDLVVQANAWFDIELIDSSEGDHFRQNASGTPSGWTEVTAPNVRNSTALLYSFWRADTSSAAAGWKIRKQSGIDLETLAANFWMSWLCGPVLFRDGEYTADIDYYFGTYRDNSGAIDETIYSRVHLQWNSAGGQWRVRGEESDGAVTNNGSWSTLTFPLHQPLFFRTVVRNDSGVKTTRQYIGTAYYASSHTQLQEAFPTTPPTWGAVWIQLHQTRGAGIQDRFLVGAIDYLGDES